LTLSHTIWTAIMAMGLLNNPLFCCRLTLGLGF
jgi:hypothetical protein